MYNSFSTKWSKTRVNHKDIDAQSLFVDIGKEPVTQRQLNLYYFFLFIKNVLQKENVQNVLEIGCGRGTAALYLSKYLNLNVSLLDYSRDAVEIARQNFKKYNQEADFYVRDALYTKFEDKTFDAVISIGLAEHFDNVESLFLEQYRILKNGGIIISLNIPKKFSIQFLNTIMRYCKKFNGDKADVPDDYYRSPRTASEYRRIAEKIKFKNVSIVHVIPFPIYTPVKISTDKKITAFNKFVLQIRKIFQKYPYKTNPLIAKAHFLVGYKK